MIYKNRGQKKHKFNVWISNVLTSFKAASNNKLNSMGPKYCKSHYLMWILISRLDYRCNSSRKLWQSIFINSMTDKRRIFGKIESGLNFAGEIAYSIQKPPSRWMCWTGKAGIHQSLLQILSHLKTKSLAGILRQTMVLSDLYHWLKGFIVQCAVIQDCSIQISHLFQAITTTFRNTSFFKCHNRQNLAPHLGCEPEVSEHVIFICCHSRTCGCGRYSTHSPPRYISN